MFVSFWQLAEALYPLHLNEPRWVNALHDVWRLGAPSPESLVTDAAIFDERVPNRGGVVQRLILPTKLAAWIMDVSAARGFPYSERQAMGMVSGVVIA